MSEERGRYLVVEEGVVVVGDQGTDGWAATRNVAEGENRWELVVDGFSGDPQLESVMAETLVELFTLWKIKQSSYGPGNIAAFGEKGCLVRANDKIKRLIRLVWEGRVNQVADETVEDSWLDLANYALMAVLCRRGLWPGVGDECDSGGDCGEQAVAGTVGEAGGGAGGG